jgi:hypothetical protein
MRVTLRQSWNPLDTCAVVGFMRACGGNVVTACFIAHAEHRDGARRDRDRAVREGERLPSTGDLSRIKNSVRVAHPCSNPCRLLQQRGSPWDTYLA